MFLSQLKCLGSILAPTVVGTRDVAGFLLLVGVGFDVVVASLVPSLDPTLVLVIRRCF